MHRDIKAGNILLDRQGNVFLSDYGVSASLKKGQKQNTLVGTPSWMAPEVCSQTGHDEKADIWSLGITLIEICEGGAPYAELAPMQVIIKIIEAQPPKLSGEEWSDELREILAHMLQKAPSQRPTCQQLLDHYATGFLGKASTPAYLKAKLLKDVPPLMGDPPQQA